LATRPTDRAESTNLPLVWQRRAKFNLKVWLPLKIKINIFEKTAPKPAFWSPILTGLAAVLQGSHVQQPGDAAQAVAAA